MTAGAVMMAFDTSSVSYVRQARWNARRIRQYLDLPVSLITDSSCADPVFDQVIQVPRPQHDNPRWSADQQQVTPWYNVNRSDVFDLTPYDRTLLIDTDYVVCSSVLRDFVTNSQGFHAYERAYDVTAQQPDRDLSGFGRFSWPLAWATVMIFGRDHVSGMIFAVMRQVRDHWQHFCDLYGISNSLYRNDYALSVALGVVSGHTGNTQALPWPMAMVMPTARVTCQDQQFHVHYQDQQDRQRRIQLPPHMDFHAMNKLDLEAMIDLA